MTEIEELVQLILPYFIDFIKMIENGNNKQKGLDNNKHPSITVATEDNINA